MPRLNERLRNTTIAGKSGIIPESTTLRSAGAGKQKARRQTDLAVKIVSPLELANEVLL